MKYFVADLHFYHKNIIKFMNRPFDDIESMNDTLIYNINSCVKKTDKLYLLGDVAFANKNKIRELFKRIVSCKKILVIGNHDEVHPRSFWNEFCNEVCEIKEVKIRDKKVILCHYPLLEWAGMHKFSWHLYGHVHGNIKHPFANTLEVTPDNNNMFPWSETDVIHKINKGV